MSAINQVITTTFRARGGQAIAQMGQVSQGFGRIGQVINQNTRLSEKLNGVWRAFGTTIRYALAGQAVFGLVRMVDQLKEVQVQMGLISAIGTTPGGGVIGGDALTGLMSQARQGAVDAITPIQDYNNAIINLLSSVENVPTNQVTKIVTEISRAAQLAQVGAEDATKAFTTMANTFEGTASFENIHRMAQEFFLLTKKAPGGISAGKEIIGQMGTLAQVTKAARGTPQDLFSLLLTTLRSGMPPAQAGRGLSFFVQTLGLPGQQVKESKDALASIGITTMTNMTLQQRMAKVFGRARQLGLRGNLGVLKNLDEETLADMEAAPGGTTGALKDLGVTGRGAAFLGTIFRRIHALRTALAILQGINLGQAQQDVNTMADGWEGHLKDVDDLNQAWKRFEKKAQLQKASVAIQAMSLQIATVFEPVLNFVAGKITGLQEVMGRHPTATKAGTWGTVGILAALGVNRLAGGRLLGRLPLVGRFLGGANLGQAAVMANAAQAAISGNQALGASPQNPLYVTVVGQLFGGGGGRGSNTIGKKTPLQEAERTAEDVAAAKGGQSLWRKIFSKGAGGGAAKWGARGLKFGKIAGPVGLAAILGDFFVNADDTNQGEDAFIARQRAQTSQRNLMRAQQIFDPNVQGIGNFAVGTAGRGAQAHGEVWMTIQIQHPGGKMEKRRVHVPVSFWQSGRYPSSKGKPRNQRSG